MKTFILVSMFFVGVTQTSLAGVDQSAQQLWTAAEQQTDLFNPDASPFQLEVEFVAQLQTTMQGHLTYRWESKDRWWRKASLGKFEEIEIKNGEKLYISRNGSFTPQPVKELLRLISIAESSPQLKITKQKRKVVSGREVDCLQVSNDGAIKGREFCVDPVSREVLSQEWKEAPDETGRVEYSDYLEFRGHLYPRKIERFQNGIKVISAQVASVATMPLDEALLVPPKGAIERRLCADMKHAVAIKSPDPEYSDAARQNRAMGDIKVSMMVLADGSVGDVHLVGTSIQSLDDATLRTLKGWKFKPAMCGADPVVSDIEVVVRFRLR